MKCFRAALFIFFLGLAHSPAARAQSLKDFVDRIQSTYDASIDLSLQFTQSTYVAVLEKEVHRKGRAQFKKPGKSRIDYEGENGRQYLSDGKVLWVFQKGDPKPQALELKEQDIPAEALNFLGGLGNLEKDFSVEEVDPKKWDALKREKGSLRWVELTPFKKSSTILSLVMAFDPASHLAREIYIFTESGNLSHYVMQNIKLNSGLSDATFEFKK